ncbi:uncharacterized protein isoform X3 [Musca autumnalis]
MYVHTGGGGKGLRPNQHSQQQQQQQGQQHHHQQHHQTHHQTPHQSHQPQQVQLQTASIHHSNQASAQTSGGNSHPHSHQQTAAPPPHQQAFQQHLPLYYYPLSQIHQQAPSSTGQHHPGQSASSNVGGAQLAPSPPTHTTGTGGGNGAQGAGGAGGNGTGAGASQASGNANTNAGAGAGVRQGQGASISNYPPTGAIIQANLQAPTSNHYMTSPYQLQLPQHNALMMYNSTLAAASAAAAGQHGTPTAGQTGPLYQTAAQAQTSAGHHPVTLQGAQQTVHYYTGTVPPQAPTSLHHPTQLRNMTVLHNPRPHYYFVQQPMPPGARTSLIPNTHQQPAAASGNTHVGAQLQNTGTRAGSAGPPTYVQPNYCTPPALPSQPQSLMTATGMGAPTIANAYGHLAGSAGASASSTSLPLAAGSTGVGLSSASASGELMKRRSKALPIIDPNTGEAITFEPPQNKSTSSGALEIKPPPEAENRPAKTTTITMTAPPAEPSTSGSKGSNDKSTTATAASAVASSATTTTTTTTQQESKGETSTDVVAGGGAATGKDKIDQQMQTEPAAAAATTNQQIPVETPVDPALQQPSCVEENDDTDAETPELEHDDDAAAVSTAEPNQLSSSMEQSAVTKESEVTKVKDSTETTETTTNTDVTPVAQKEDEAGVIKQHQQQQQQQQPVTTNVESEQFVEIKQSSSTANTTISTPSLETNKSNNKQQQHQSHGKIPITTATSSTITSSSAAVVDKSTKEDTNRSVENPNKKDVTEEITATIKELNISTKTTTTTATTSSNKDQQQHQQQQGKTTTTSTTNTKMGANTTTTPSIGNVNTNKKGGDATKSSNNNVPAAANPAATNAVANDANDDSFITVSNRKNRKVNKQQQQQQQQQQQRTKDNQKKPQNQQQRPQHERSNSTASNASSNNKSHNNNNNNRGGNNAAATSSVPSTPTAASNVQLTDIHNANNSSSNVNNNNTNTNNNKQAQRQQSSTATTPSATTKEPPAAAATTVASANNNNNVDTSKQPAASVEIKDNDNTTAAPAGGKHVKSQEIVEQFIQPSTKASASSNAADTSKVEAEQIQFLNSSSSACEEEELKVAKSNTETTTSTTTKPAADNEAAAIKDVSFGDFKDNEKVKEAIKTSSSTTSVSSKTETTANTTETKTPDNVDCSSNAPAPAAVAAGAAAAPVSKSSKILHVAPSITKHPKTGKSLYRYSLDELKQLAKSQQSLKIPNVPCQKGGCVASLFVARPNNQNLPHMKQQYQQMDFNESMDLVSGKRGNRGQRKHDHNMTGSCGNIAGAGGPPGPGGSMIGTTGGSVSVTGTSFARPMRMIRVNLSLNEEIKLNESENAWKPETLRKKTGGPSNSDSTTSLNDNIDAVLKKVRGVLNKLTPENFDVLLKTMVSISLDTTEKMQQVMLLIFEKTISEPNFAPTYAKFCKVLFQEVKPESKQLFNTLLIKRIQTEFETNVNNADAKNEKLKPLIEKLDACTDPKERLELQAELEDQEYQFRRRAWGTVRFIGEMFKLQSLTGDRVMLCIESLLEHGSEEKLEYMCKLMTTVGHLLEAKYSAEKNITRMDRVLIRINEIIKQSRSNKNNHNKISSRVRFMMQDVVDLRARRWDQTASPSTTQSGPTSVSSGGGSSSMSGSRGSDHQNRRGNRDDKNNRNNYDRGGSSQRMGGGGRDGRDYGNNNQGRRGQDNRDYYNKNSQKGQYQVPDQMDFKKLNFSRGLESESSTKLGNPSLFMWRTSGRSQGGLLQNATAPPFGGGGMSSSGSQQYGGSSSNSSNLANNTMKRPTNPFQVLSREPDTDRHQNSDVERPSASHTSASSSSNEGSDDEDEKAVAIYSSTEVRKMINELVEEYFACAAHNSFEWQNIALSKWRSYSLKQHMEIVHCLLMDYLHLRETSKDDRAAVASIFLHLLRAKTFDKKAFARSYDQFAEEFSDVLVDVPTGWDYIFEFFGPLLHDRQLSFDDIWRADWKEDFFFVQKFAKALIVHFTKEFGTNYVRDLWHKEFKLDKGQVFTNDPKKWQEFINSNRLQYIYDVNVNPPSEYTSCVGVSVDKKVKRLLALLKGRDNCDLAIDYINTNVNINDEFLRHFARFLCCDYATVMTSSSSSSSTKKDSGSSTKIPQVNADKFRKICVPMLRLCIDAQEKYELACLDAVHDGIQYEYSDYAVVDDITCNIIELLYDSDVISKESLDKWYRQRLAADDSSSDTSKTKMRGGQQQQQLSAKFQAFLQKLL